MSVQGPDFVAEMATFYKEVKYTTLPSQNDFQPIAVETLDPVNEFSLASGQDIEPQYLFQRIPVAIQRFYAVLLHDCFLSSDIPD